MTKRAITLAFAAVFGWYLLEPALKYNSQLLPIGIDTRAPLAEWNNAGAFDSARAWEEQRIYDLNHHARWKGDDRDIGDNSREPQNVDTKDFRPLTDQELKEASARFSCVFGNHAKHAAVCIATDDPRLKGIEVG